MKRSVILLNKTSEQSSGDELDVLFQAQEVEKALILCGYNSKRIIFGLDLDEVLMELEETSPDVVFNLVESVGGTGELIHFAPSFLESLNIPFTGAGSFSMYITSNKLIAKKKLIEEGIRTPTWVNKHENFKLKPEGYYILKPVWEDGSKGISDKSVISGKYVKTKDLPEYDSKKMFLEEYIAGREFNLSLLGGKPGPEVLPPAEMLFMDYPPEKPRILNYASKWNENSFEYKHSVRSFEIDLIKDTALIQELKKISLRCWDSFGLKGYARVDFRVDDKNIPYVIEVNANPCISPDSGFMAAAGIAGYSSKEVVERILHDAFN